MPETPRDEDFRQALEALETTGARDALNALDNLPRLACGGLCYPGRMIGRDYLGNPWEARIVYVGDSTIDIQYTNKGTHAAKGAVSRLKNPAEWVALSHFEKSAPPV